MGDLILVLNAGSSSVKFALYPRHDGAAPQLSGSVERIGPSAEASITDAEGQKTTSSVSAYDHGMALDVIAQHVQRAHPGAAISHIGHRIVHGGTQFADPVLITADVRSGLDALKPLAPLHLPHGLRGIEEAARLYPNADQVACFDTAFHAEKPWVHDSFALPPQFYQDGLRRYGFHGLSCQSIVRQLRAERFPLDERRVVIAHLGNGCSATAVLGGKSHATSMGFSTLDGVVMGTRCGGIDPGVLIYWLHQGKDVREIETILYHRSGLLGLSGLSNDMRDLQASKDPNAIRAVDMFVARLAEEIARLAATMGGLDSVVFCGGIGENAADIRGRVLDRLSFLDPEPLVRQTREDQEIMFAVRDIDLRHPPR